MAFIDDVPAFAAVEGHTHGDGAGCIARQGDLLRVVDGQTVYHHVAFAFDTDAARIGDDAAVGQQIADAAGDGHVRGICHRQQSSGYGHRASDGDVPGGVQIQDSIVNRRRIASGADGEIAGITLSFQCPAGYRSFAALNGHIARSGQHQGAALQGDRRGRVLPVQRQGAVRRAVDGQLTALQLQHIGCRTCGQRNGDAAVYGQCAAAVLQIGGFLRFFRDTASGAGDIVFPRFQRCAADRDALRALRQRGGGQQAQAQHQGKQYAESPPQDLIVFHVSSSVSVMNVPAPSCRAARRG